MKPLYGSEFTAKLMQLHKDYPHWTTRQLSEILCRSTKDIRNTLARLRKEGRVTRKTPPRRPVNLGNRRPSTKQV